MPSYGHGNCKVRGRALYKGSNDAESTAKPGCQLHDATCELSASIMTLSRHYSAAVDKGTWPLMAVEQLHAECRQKELDATHWSAMCPATGSPTRAFNGTCSGRACMAYSYVQKCTAFLLPPRYETSCLSATATVHLLHKGKALSHSHCHCSPKYQVTLLVSTASCKASGRGAKQSPLSANSSSQSGYSSLPRL